MTAGHCMFTSGANPALRKYSKHWRNIMLKEDQLISGYIAASLEACQIHIGRRFDDGLEFTPAIKIGCMMFIAHLYENRQIVADNAKTRVPMTIGALWTAYRDVGVY